VTDPVPDPTADPAPTELPIAAPGKRLLGALLDGVIFLLLALISYSSDTAPQRGLAIAWLVIHAAYQIGLTATRGQTIGKMVVGTQVVDESGGRLPTWGQALVRWLVPAVPNLVGILLLSSAFDAVSVVWSVVVYLPILNRPDRRGWHDRIAGTVVIDRAPAQDA
jgi:uncharacterized RDD family membrane protein YckC